MHDWTRVESGIYHDFHHEWISSIKHALNALLPSDYYALAEQHAAGFGPDVLTLERKDTSFQDPPSVGTATMSRPQTRLQQEGYNEFYRRKQKSVVVYHSSGDVVVSVVEIVSPGNKDSTRSVRAFVDKACHLLDRRIHLLVIDPFPINSRLPHGLHSAIFEDRVEDPIALPKEQPLCAVAYECGNVTRAYLEPMAVGDALPDMPVFLEEGYYVTVPLEQTYIDAWNAVPKRWQVVIADQQGKA